MNCEISPKLEGCRVVIEMRIGKIEGEVKSVDPSGCKLSIVNGKVVATGVQLPLLYRVFERDILSISVVEQSVVANAEKPGPSGVIPKLSPSINSPKILQQLTPPSDKKIQPLVAQKNLPYHIKIMNNNVKKDVLTNQVPFTENGKEADSIPSLPNYTILEQIDDLYSSAVDRISKESVIGLSMEGVRTGRFGVICWIGIAISDHTFLFDMCSLGSAGVKLGLSSILSDSRVIKVIHNCRFITDALLHQYSTKLDNVFDTQVGASVVDLKKNGTFNKYATPLTRALNHFLNMPIKSMFHPRVREGHEREDMAIWKQRPLPQHLIEGAVFNVCHLKKLRLAIMEDLLSEVIQGTTLYMNDISLLDDDAVADKEVTAHLIPVSFKDLCPSSRMRDEDDFSSAVPSNGCDPYVSFTRNISHVRRN